MTVREQFWTFRNKFLPSLFWRSKILIVRAVPYSHENFCEQKTHFKNLPLKQLYHMCYKKNEWNILGVKPSFCYHKNCKFVAFSSYGLFPTWIYSLFLFPFPFSSVTPLGCPYGRVRWAILAAQVVKTVLLVSFFARALFVFLMFPH